jgi:16S rRNA G966 N2-methylase RsmD
MADMPSTEHEAHFSGFTDPELEFIQQHILEDVNQLILKSALYKALDVKKLAAQILARQKAVKKLPEWSAMDTIIFPPALSVEQSSSEATARYKSSILSGNTLIDITGGMGVDCYYMSRNFDKAIYFEQQQDVARTAGFNFKILGNSKIVVKNEDSLISLQKNNPEADWLYADPARRDNNKDKVVRLSDCTPDVVSHLHLLQKTAPDILIKTSPLLDIDLAVKELRNVKEVHIIGYDQECKELLFHINRDHHTPDFKLRVRILNQEGTVEKALDFDRHTEQSSVIQYSYPLSYLYEPHAAVLKAGAFKIPGSLFGVSKLAASSHLYTSEQYIPDFPGRSFQILGFCKPDAGEILKLINGNKANLTLRNFPAKIQDLRKKWRLKEGGDFYLFATTLFDNKKLVVVTKKPESKLQ